MKVFRWDRSGSGPEVEGGRGERDNPICFSVRGFIANREALLRRFGLDPSTPDDALIIQLYRHSGPAAARLIDGPCSWVIWDADRQQLVAVCDRLGTFGHYYTALGRVLLLADSVETVLNCSLGHASFETDSLVAHINMLAPSRGSTYYAGVDRVPPGSMLIVGRDRLDVRQYWSIEPQPALRFGSDQEYAEAFQELLFSVVSEYVSDRPGAVTVSSGLDSTSVAAAMRSLAPEAQLTALSWVANELPSADESHHASAVHELLDMSVLWIPADQYWPLSGPAGMRSRAAAPTHSFYAELWSASNGELRRNGVKVVYTGAGGDQLFGAGVSPFADLLLTGRWLALFRQLRVSIPEAGWIGYLRPRLIGLPLRAYWPGCSRFAPSPIPWMTEQFKPIFDHMVRPRPRSRRCLPGKLQRLDALAAPFFWAGVEEFNLQASEQGVEARHPLLDHRLMEFALSLPTDQTVRASTNKVIVRNAMRGLLPDAVLDLKRKILPGAIARRGLRDRERNKVWALMTDMRLADLGIVNEARLQQTYRNYLQGVEDPWGYFWYTMAVEDWLRRYF